MEQVLYDLKNAIRKRNVMLFVGAGISATIGLPTWQKLINHIASELGYDERLFEVYAGRQVLAEYYEIQKNGLGELSQWMLENWSGYDEQISASSIYKSIVELGFPIIYTTNYDHCLEKAFELRGADYKKIVRAADFVGIDTNTTQIVKFHGDMSDISSIVLSESSYFSRFDFESPLDIKLRADMIGKSILFVGYSLSDVNLRYLIYKLDQLWKKGGSESSPQRPASYIYLSAPNPIQQAVFERRGIHTIVGDSLDKSRDTEVFFSKLQGEL